jgi:Tol biopolymer transport system component
MQPALPAPSELPPPQTILVTATAFVTTAASTDRPGVVLRQISQNGCCVQPFWSADSRSVLFIDRPDESSPVGLWKIDLAGGSPQFLTDKLGIYSRDMQLRAYLEAGETIVERLADGQRWPIPNGGRSISFSPSGAQVAWTTGQSGPPFDTARREIWISSFDGSLARRALTMVGGGFSGWLSDGRILVSGRPDDAAEVQAIWAVDLPADGSPATMGIELARAERLRSTVISPSGAWVVYLVSFSSNAEQNGLWLVNTTTGEQRKLELFGAYRWRAENRLLIIPQEPGAPANRIVEIEAASGRMTSLTDPAIQPFKIAGGDWSVAPDGKHIVFVSAGDYNLWVLQLP